MKIFGFGRDAFSICVALATLAGCASQPGSLPQNSAIAPARTPSHRILPASSFKVLHNFDGDPDGEAAVAGLDNVKGTLYGTTFFGGEHGVGIVYSISLDGAEKVLHSFGHGSDGVFPLAGLIHIGDTLYGTTEDGGTSDKGTVFSIGTDGIEKVLHSFGGGSDGAKPFGGLSVVDGTLYGTTSEGGTSNKGTVFSIGTDGAEKVLHNFGGGSDGATPLAGVSNLDYTYGGNTLYGTTKNGGTSDKGTVYSIDIYGTEKVLYSFGGGSDGAHPEAGLTDVYGTMYGTTLAGGTSNEGTVYSIDLIDTEKVVHSFSGGSDGESPYAGLIYVSGKLYGTTFLGGGYGCFGHGCGTVYSITTDGTEKVLYDFYGPDGAKIEAGLLHHGGKLYGATSEGGRYGRGTVYALTL